MSCVDIKNEKMIHPYIVTGTSASSDRKNESNGELFKLKIRENQDVDLKIAIMAIVEKKHKEVLRLIQTSHQQNGILQDEIFNVDSKYLISYDNRY